MKGWKKNQERQAIKLKTRKKRYAERFAKKKADKEARKEHAIKEYQKQIEEAKGGEDGQERNKND